MQLYNRLKLAWANKICWLPREKYKTYTSCQIHHHSRILANIFCREQAWNMIATTPTSQANIPLVFPTKTWRIFSIKLNLQDNDSKYIWNLNIYPMNIFWNKGYNDSFQFFYTHISIFNCSLLGILWFPPHLFTEVVFVNSLNTVFFRAFFPANWTNIYHIIHMLRK